MPVVAQKQKVLARNYWELIVWQDGIKLATTIYKLTETFPRTETFALEDQIRRASISIPSNIAEGQARKTPSDFCRFLHIALGSLDEIDTQLVLAQELQYLSDQDTMSVDQQIIELRKKLYALINSLS